MVQEKSILLECFPIVVYISSFLPFDHLSSTAYYISSTYFTPQFYLNTLYILSFHVIHSTIFYLLLCTFLPLALSAHLPFTHCAQIIFSYCLAHFFLSLPSNNSLLLFSRRSAVFLHLFIFVS